jgi:hypothetical protein
MDAESESVSITLGNLAVSLNAPMGRLEALVEGGWIHRVSSGQLTSQSLVQMPPPEALKWLRQWLQPVYAKPMFTQLDMAELLGVTSAQVIELAAAHDIPVIWDPHLGHLYSMWSAKQLLIRVLSGRKEVGTRFDRQAFLWNLMDGDPARAAELPAYDELLENEIERVAQLPEPQRSLRSAALRDHFRDASAVLTSATSGSLSSEQSRPAQHASEASDCQNETPLQACERVFSRPL